jgi:hypothetical protein
VLFQKGSVQLASPGCLEGACRGAVDTAVGVKGLLLTLETRLNSKAKDSSMLRKTDEVIADNTSTTMCR